MSSGTSCLANLALRDGVVGYPQQGRKKNSQAAKCIRLRQSAPRLAAHAAGTSLQARRAGFRIAMPLLILHVLRVTLWVLADRASVPGYWDPQEEDRGQSPRANSDP
jgi:hypothetical protein